jgi:hypothetical protein
MSNTIRYADLWALLRKLGFDVGTLDGQNHRVCEFVATDTRIVLHDYPPDQPVRAEILIGVRLQLDNSGIMSRAEFERWAARRTKATAAVASNGVQPRGKTRKA